MSPGCCRSDAKGAAKTALMCRKRSKKKSNDKGGGGYRIFGFFADKCGKIIAIIGIILSAILLNFLLLYAFIFAFIGINNNRHGYLTATKIILVINIVVDSLMSLFFIYLAIAMPRDLFDNLSDYEDNKTSMRITYSVFSVVLLSIIAFLSFAFKIFHQAQHVIQNTRRCSIFPVTNSCNTSNAAPIYTSNSPYPVTDAPPYSTAAGYPSGYDLNPPSYSQAYNSSQELPSKSHDMNAIPFQPTYPQLDSTNS